MARNKYPEQTRNLIIDTALQLFTQKGYDDTSIQDIVDHLGGLSKGAIYHHFKSKDEIFDAVGERISERNTSFFNQIRDDTSKTGLQKLKAMLQSAYTNPTNDVVIAMISRILSDPKFMSTQILQIYELTAPLYVQPIIEEGIKDGSIQTEYPKELAEVVITLINVWINPIIAKSTPEELRRKLDFLSILLRNLGVDVIDEQTIKQYTEISKRYIV